MTLGRIGFNSASAFFAIAICGPIFWFLLDRQPPFIRTNGEMIPPNPSRGEQVEVKWDVKVLKQCHANTEKNVTRTVTSSSGQVHTFAPIAGVFGSDSRKEDKEFARGFQVPVYITPGPAKYRAVACFACNPVQYLWPVCVTEPEIAFEIRP